MMRGFWWMVRVLLVLYVLGFTFARESRAAEEKGDVVDLMAVPVSQVVSLYFKEIANKPYVICSDVLGDARPVSIRAHGRVLDSVMLGMLLDVYGYSATMANGVTVICKKAEKKAEVEEFAATVIFRPEYREVGYLVELTSTLVRGVFANKRTSAPALAVGGEDRSNQSGQSNQAPMMQSSASSGSTFRASTGDDFLIFSGTDKEADKLRKLLTQLDTPAGEVLIKGYVYEVGKSDNEQAALDLFVSALKDKVSVSIAGATFGNSLRLKTAALDVVASAIKSDSHFKLVTSPYARVRSGGTARFMAGADVPVLGSIVTNATGQTQQSVEYRSSGTILEVAPKVRGKITDVDLFQQVSNFVLTESGVNGSPTLSKRELRTSLSVEDGELIVIGGLVDTKEVNTRSGLWFLPFNTSKGRSENQSEILVVLELKRL